ncbi:DUF4351 domain-containing protein [Dactylococcopsis salina]|uniref:DUF4351 domain-containing protein n=1 Tax=Dactylococcopsis salina (strain PCC 8305) TaxID=13035 RepID=K9YY60_DACS8|nr:DUF4351 domain-containing protein [Dactylococcopsis salina]AFZ51886.1 hypothetical protein Dacsa_3387 [Dactylococcopsis salina PCC 8305]
MTRHPFDQLAKQLLEQLLTPCGKVEISREVPGEPRFIDLYFSPEANVTPNQATLGILAAMVQSPGLFEPFRNPPTLEEIESCLLKRLWLVSDLRRRQALNNSNPPLLWIIAPTLSQNLLTRLGAVKKENWLEGVYELAPAFQTVVIVVHQLPKTSETLWLRLLGKGRVQQQAVAEVIALPEGDTRRTEALRLLSVWKIIVEANPELPEGEEVTMPLPQAFLEWEQQVEERGKKEGKKAEAQSLVWRLISRRFGDIPSSIQTQIEELDIEETEALAEALLDFTSIDDLQRWLQQNEGGTEE